jgi:hypothetical protein
MGKTISKPPDLDNCILISSSPMFYPKVNKYLYMLCKLNMLFRNIS